MLGRRTAVVVATALAIVAVVALLVLAAEVLLLVFARLSFAVLLSSLADALVGISGMGRRMALGLTVLVLPAGPGGDGVGAVALCVGAGRLTSHRTARGASGVARLVRTAGVGAMAARAR